jgi:hypothetical protein
MTLLRWYVHKGFLGNSIPARPTSLQKGNILKNKFKATHAVRLIGNLHDDCISRQVDIMFDANSGTYAFKIDVIWKDGQEPTLIEFSLSKYAYSMMLEGLGELNSNLNDWEIKPTQESSPHPSPDKSDQRIAP